jgi:hypothetical protein
MLLTTVQKEWIEDERTRLKNEIARKPQLGILTLHMELAALNVLVGLNNVEIRAQNAKIKAEERARR